MAHLYETIMSEWEIGSDAFIYEGHYLLDEPRAVSIIVKHPGRGESSWLLFTPETAIEMARAVLNAACNVLALTAEDDEG